MGFVHFADPSTAVELAFPGLGLEFSLSREAVFIGPFTIYWYGLIVVSGIALGIAYALWRAGQFGIDRDKLSDVILYSVMVSLVGARAYYVAFSWDYYKLHSDEIIQIWKGGIAFYGGVTAALICAYLLCRRWHISFIHGTDAALGGLLLGQSIGRWGNFVNIEAFGGYFDGAWRMVSPAVDSYFHAFPDRLPGFTAEQVAAMSEIPVHPAFFYESLWTMLGFLFMVWYTKRRCFTGELTLMYFFINGLGRMFIEGLRTDSLAVSGIRVSQILAGLMAAASFAVWIWATGKVKAKTAPAWMALEIPAQAAPLENAQEPQTETETVKTGAENDLKGENAADTPAAEEEKQDK